MELFSFSIDRIVDGPIMSTGAASCFLVSSMYMLAGSWVQHSLQSDMGPFQLWYAACRSEGTGWLWCLWLLEFFSDEDAPALIEKEFLYRNELCPHDHNLFSGRSTHFTALSFPMIPHSGRQIWHRSVKLGNGLNKIGNFPRRAFGQLKKWNSTCRLYWRKASLGHVDGTKYN